MRVRLARLFAEAGAPFADAHFASCAAADVAARQYSSLCGGDGVGSVVGVGVDTVGVDTVGVILVVDNACAGHAAETPVARCNSSVVDCDVIVGDHDACSVASPANQGGARDRKQSVDSRDGVVVNIIVIEQRSHQ